MDIIWKDRKRTFLGLPWSFTKYSLDAERLYIKRGVFTTYEDEVRLYRIIDLTLRRSFGQRILGIGTIHCCSSDASMKEFDILNIKNSKKVKALISDLIEEERIKKRVYNRESLDVHGHDDHEPPEPPDHDVMDDYDYMDDDHDDGHDH